MVVFKPEDLGIAAPKGTDEFKQRFYELKYLPIEDEFFAVKSKDGKYTVRDYFKYFAIHPIETAYKDAEVDNNYYYFRYRLPSIPDECIDTLYDFEDDFPDDDTKFDEDYSSLYEYPTIHELYNLSHAMDRQTKKTTIKKVKADPKHKMSKEELFYDTVIKLRAETYIWGDSNLALFNFVQTKVKAAATLKKMTGYFPFNIPDWILGSHRFEEENFKFDMDDMIILTVVNEACKEDCVYGYKEYTGLIEVYTMLSPMEVHYKLCQLVEKGILSLDILRHNECHGAINTAGYVLSVSYIQWIIQRYGYSLDNAILKQMDEMRKEALEKHGGLGGLIADLCTDLNIGEDEPDNSPLTPLVECNNILNNTNH